MEPHVTVDLSFCLLPFMTSLTTLVHRDGAHRIETVAGQTCEESNWNVTDRGSHVDVF